MKVESVLNVAFVPFQLISSRFELTDWLNVECWMLIDWLIECRFYTFPFLFKQFELTDWLIDWLIDWLNAECWMLLLYFSSCLQAVLSWLIDWMPKGKLETCARYQFSLKERRCKILENTRNMSQGCKILERCHKDVQS